MIKFIIKRTPKYNLFFFIFFIFYNNKPNPIPAKIYISAGIWPKFSGMIGMDRNSPKFDPRWNVGYSGTNLHTDTKNFGRFGRNGMESITMVRTKWSWLNLNLGETKRSWPNLNLGERLGLNGHGRI